MFERLKTVDFTNYYCVSLTQCENTVGIYGERTLWEPVKIYYLTIISDVFIANPVLQVTEHDKIFKKFLMFSNQKTNKTHIKVQTIPPN